MTQEVTYNEFVQRLGEWVCLHDENIHFRGWPSETPLIKLCSETLRVRANQAWKKLPIEDQECMVAHELGQPGALFAPFVMVGILLTTAMSGLWVYSVINSESSNRYYLSKEGGQDTCIRIVEDINWGQDIEASECYPTAEAALPTLVKLREATYVKNKTEEEKGTDRTTSSSFMGSSSSLVPTLRSYEGQEEGRGQECLQAESE